MVYFELIYGLFGWNKTVFPIWLAGFLAMSYLFGYGIYIFFLWLGLGLFGNGLFGNRLFIHEPLLGYR